jgi:hypothetical protein
LTVVRGGHEARGERLFVIDARVVDDLGVGEQIDLGDGRDRWSRCHLARR